MSKYQHLSICFPGEPPLAPQERYDRSAIARPCDFNAYSYDTLCLSSHSLLPARALQQAPRFRALGLRDSFPSSDVCFGVDSRTRGIGQRLAPRQQHSAYVFAHRAYRHAHWLFYASVGERCKSISRSLPATFPALHLFPTTLPHAWICWGAPQQWLLC